MKTPLVLSVAVTAAISGAAALHAQTGARAPLPAFYMADFELTDPEGIKPYSAQVASTFEPFGGRFIVRGGRTANLEGEPSKGRLVVIAFDSMEKAQAWYDSPAYRALRPIRQNSGRSRTFIIEGSGG
ncbi:uncharacterized protein (DUF1330 family) [Bosea sp. BE125]|uniref:DUF1330 domain-containing protein n=1 Tax=Bosea sp. BE125 TaxID=2817909 RepID=UPI002863010A|nr:DUF1330 domain-containing protein [Bosea sp. BE125]MDR6872217.1 uncharacterized protein (DUF1330 family) [Bosea sp. BE125]